MRLQTLLFYVVPNFAVTATVAFFTYRKGGVELLIANGPKQATAFALFCAVSFVCYKLDDLITGHRKHVAKLVERKEQKAGGIRRREEPTVGELE